jgi:hypothetical protein
VPPKVGIYSSQWQVYGRIKFGASDYWRLVLPGMELARNGWEIVPARMIHQWKDGTLVLQDERGYLHGDCEIIVWQRYMGDTVDIIHRAQAAGQVIVQDVDDNFWALPRQHQAHARIDPRWSKVYNRDHYRENIKASSLITVSTPWLANALDRWGPPVETVRNYIDLKWWGRHRPPGPYIGWVGAIQWRGADLQLLCKTVVPWLRQHREPFYHGGHSDLGPSAVQVLGYDNVVPRQWTELGNYPSLWSPLRIALCPIESSSFGLAKSWVKGLEACARGIPFIASDHPAYRELGVGRLVKRPRDWVEHLEDLQDPVTYEAECLINRAKARELDIAKNWQHWANVLEVARDHLALAAR